MDVVLLSFNLSWIILGIILILAAIIGGYLLKFAIWIRLVLIIAGVLLASFDFIICFFSQFV